MNESVSIQMDDNFSFPYRSRKLLAQKIVDHFPIHRPIVFVCIGTDRSTGDALGPLVGNQLSRYHFSDFHIYGTTAHPVHAKNLEQTMQRIQKMHTSPYIIAIDACLGVRQQIGTILYKQGPISPGSAFQKELSPVGDCHIAGIVNMKGMMDFFVLQSTRLHHVLCMANGIATSIRSASMLYEQKKATFFAQKAEKKQPKFTFFDKFRSL
ncbi:spore protease YyaC [Massilibacterium senegalense]|uniref:spore protease YyaC n=1 Tax=Massilibacterium senegalense TaxID=1632858 RepID=UPI0007848672|nr:spore protease YyaC [Massilibacterium senegalense]